MPTKAYAIKDAKGCIRRIAHGESGISELEKATGYFCVNGWFTEQEPQQVASGESPPVITPQEAALLPDTDAGRSNGPVAEWDTTLGTVAFHASTENLSMMRALGKGKLYAADPSTITVPRKLLERAMFYEIYVKDDPAARDDLRAMLKQEKPT